ncbi:hypothetical protein J437_LFUL010162 [Ladona fulva]|uniref:Uncharacterized protein n=1 Tax=Ladona fulva TaxID=123851 RepID=A0A8K0KAD5_LADFU|nr:hypothetical protein J437_LFUL010162 [Ladona fulva]
MLLFQKMESSNLTPRTKSLVLIASISALVKRSLENLGIHFKTNEMLSTSFSQSTSDAKHSVINMKQIIEEAVAFRREVRTLTIEKLKSKTGDEDHKEYWKKVMGSCDTFRQNLQASGVTIKDHGKTSSWQISESDSGKT